MSTAYKSAIDLVRELKQKHGNWQNISEMLLDRLAKVNIEQGLNANDIVSPYLDIASPLLIGATLALLAGDDKHPEFSKLGVKKVKKT